MTKPKKKAIKKPTPKATWRRVSPDRAEWQTEHARQWVWVPSRALYRNHLLLVGFDKFEGGYGYEVQWDPDVFAEVIARGKAKTLRDAKLIAEWFARAMREEAKQMADRVSWMALVGG